MTKLYNFLSNFICRGYHEFKFKIGNLTANSLSGFIAGVLFASIFWIIVALFLKYFPIIALTYPDLF